MPSFSDSEEDEDQTEEEFDFGRTLGTQLRSMRRSCHTSTTYRHGRAVVSLDDDDGGGGDGRAAGDDDVDWDNIEEDEE